MSLQPAWASSPKWRCKSQEGRKVRYIRVSSAKTTDKLLRRYYSVDYIVLSTLIGMTTLLLISYDIACQYSKNFAKRGSDFPPCMRLQPETAENLRWAIPKKHWPNHGRKDHSQYSFNFIRWVGRTYGEGIEASWAHMNAVSMSTKEMAPSARQEVLDDHWSAWNWHKIRNFGECHLADIADLTSDG